VYRLMNSHQQMWISREEIRGNRLASTPSAAAAKHCSLSLSFAAGASSNGVSAAERQEVMLVTMLPYVTHETQQKRK
jgi:hypothetical protein